MQVMHGITIQCHRCDGLMELGFVLDSTYGKLLQSKWVEGMPVKSFLAGLRLRGKRQLTITTFRCMSCGYLESYAK